jgi:predicted ABC-type ATPase
VPALPPLVVVIGGPNGAGKTTTAPRLLQEALAVSEFVNADGIALGLSAFRPESAALPAGRAMLARLKVLAEARADFAFETTLASRSFVPWLRRLRESGYHVHLAFLALPDPDLAVARVAARVRSGGHAVPDGVIRRRFTAGLVNLFDLYLPLVDTWQVLDNSASSRARPIAVGRAGGEVEVLDAAAWRNLREKRR